LVDGELHGLLVVRNSGERALLDGWHGLTTWDDRSEDIAFHGNTERERNDIKKQEVGSLSRLGLAGEDTSLDSSTVGDSFIRVDALFELLVVEELAEQLLYPGNTCGTTDKHNLVNLSLVDASVLQDLLNRLKGASECLGVEILETGTSDGGGEILTVEERVDLNGGLGGVGKGTLGTLASGTETTQSTGIARKV
jgi:hypothetical protein